MNLRAGADVELFANDLSIHEQFHDIGTFRNAVASLMAMRKAALLFGRELYCSHAFSTVSPMQDTTTMQKAIGRFSRDEQRAVMQWLGNGPFWDGEARPHDAKDRLECRGEIVTDVTDHAVGEAAFRTLHGVECGLVSVTPSDWDYAPVAVTWNRAAEGLEDRCTELENWRDADALKAMLRDAAPPIQSWDELRKASAKRFKGLCFAEDCFSPLLAGGVPFAKPAAERFLGLLDVLDRFARAFDADGRRSPEGHRIYQNHFTGDNAWFSDSSDSEKNDFRQQLMFPHPTDPDRKLPCTWHGKVRHGTLRLHYSWSGKDSEPVYIVYAGKKLTRR